MWPFKKRKLNLRDYQKVRQNLHNAFHQYIEILRNEGDTRPTIVAALLEELLLTGIPNEWYIGGFIDLRGMMESQVNFMERNRGIKFPEKI